MWQKYNKGPKKNQVFFTRTFHTRIKKIHTDTAGFYFLTYFVGFTTSTVDSTAADVDEGNGDVVRVGIGADCKNGAGAGIFPPAGTDGLGKSTNTTNNTAKTASTAPRMINVF